MKHPANRTLVVTNDFPPKHGGIEEFVFALCSRLPADEVVVYASSKPGDAEFDAGLPFPVIREPVKMLLPTPRLMRRATQLFQEYHCTSVLFGAAAPLGLAGHRLRKAGAQRIVALTHGHETWWARFPVSRSVMRRIGERCDVLTYISDWCRDVIAPALTPEAAARMKCLVPAVDSEKFSPGGGGKVRESLGIDADTPVVVCLSRMVPRKGQDTLIQAWPQVVSEVPEALLLLVGGGIYKDELEGLVKSCGVEQSVIFTGAVEETPPYFSAGDVFAMPCRRRNFGFDVEGLGMVFLEAQACGVPVIVGDSGGASDAVIHGETGYLVDPHDTGEIAERITYLLKNPAKRREMGERGRAWVSDEWRWEKSVEVLHELLTS